MESSVSLKGQNLENDEQKKASWGSWAFFLVSLVILFVIFRFIIGVITISGDSMNPTLEDGDILLTSNLFYTVDRNDIIIFRDENGFNVIKRVIGLPNDTIAIQDGIVSVNGEMINETYTTGLPNDMEEVIVPSESYFVIGDNRTPGESLDSRSDRVGSINESNVLGKVMISIFPFSLKVEK
ncbi:signal peptidase I [Paucisalibacillus globulus]|uniref:signal peptidase I n=1 Tax=Paucisalibacillus globulus TaxID=351095 RepID=UPI0003FD5EAA|nr:signal peptidase I [Paucisalibacillus globulus]